jgi:hypothetical protein
LIGVDINTEIESARPNREIEEVIPAPESLTLRVGWIIDENDPIQEVEEGLELGVDQDEHLEEDLDIEYNDLKIILRRDNNFYFYFFFIFY